MEPILPFALELPRDRVRGLVHALHEQLQAAILDGRLGPGYQMPPTRKLAGMLGISRNSVVAVFDLLFSQGYLIGRPGAGTFVAENLPVRTRGGRDDQAALLAGRLVDYWRQYSGGRQPEPPSPRRYDFRVGRPDLALFPSDIWRRLASRAFRGAPLQDAGYREAEGRKSLREAIAGHVSHTRALACIGEDIVVTAGAQQAFDLIARILVRPGETRVAVEDPGYPPAREAFAAAGAKIVAIPIDEEGIRVDRIPSDVAIIVVTPSHQFPLGYAMSQRRRATLLSFVHRHGIAVVEDDYDGEFRFGGRPLDALQTADDRRSVFYVGTFSKSLFPSLRLGYVIPPQWARNALVAARRIADWHGPPVEQETLAAFITEGHLARHVRKMRRIYAERRDVLQGAIAHHGTGLLSPIATDVGLHLTMRIEGVASGSAIVAAAAARDVGIEAVDTYAIDDRSSGLVLGIGLIEAADIEEGVSRIVLAVEQAMTRKGRS